MRQHRQERPPLRARLASRGDVAQDDHPPARPDIGGGLLGRHADGHRAGRRVAGERDVA